MGKFSEALRQEVEDYEAEERATIGGLDKEGLVKWCRAQMKIRADMMRRYKISSVQCVTQDDEDALLSLARRGGWGREFLINEAKNRRRDGEAIPDNWRDYIVDLHLRIGRPDGRGQGNQAQRDEVICECIWLIERNTSFKARRNAASERPCAISIVSEALEGTGYKIAGYNGVERVWANRPDHFK